MARWNFEDIMDKLMPLLEAKIAFTQRMTERALSLEEKKEANRTDLEYRKLEAQITSEKDKLKWDKEKTGMTLASNLTVQQAQSAGLLDVAKEHSRGAKEKAEIDSIAHKYGADATVLAAKWKALPDLTTAAKGTRLKTTDPNTGVITESVSPGSQEAKEMSTVLGRSLGVAPVGGAATGRTANGNPIEGIRGIYSLIENQRAFNGNAFADDIFNKQPPAVQADILAHRQSLGVSTASPAPPVAAAPPPAVPAPTNPAVPLKSLTEAAPVATVVQPVGQPAPTPVSPVVPSGAAPVAEASPVVPQKTVAAAGPLESGGKTAFGGTPGGVLGEIWNRGAIQAAKNLKKRDEDEAKRLGGVFSRPNL